MPPSTAVPDLMTPRRRDAQVPSLFPSLFPSSLPPLLPPFPFLPCFRCWTMLSLPGGPPATTKTETTATPARRTCSPASKRNRSPDRSSSGITRPTLTSSVTAAVFDLDMYEVYLGTNPHSTVVMNSIECCFLGFDGVRTAMYSSSGTPRGLFASHEVLQVLVWPHANFSPPQVYRDDGFLFCFVWCV